METTSFILLIIAIISLLCVIRLAIHINQQNKVLAEAKRLKAQTEIELTNIKTLVFNLVDAKTIIDHVYKTSKDQKSTSRFTEKYKKQLLNNENATREVLAELLVLNGRQRVLLENQLKELQTNFRNLIKTGSCKG